jgi:hypothetical protein
MEARQRGEVRRAWAYKALALLLVAGALGYALSQLAPGQRATSRGTSVTTAARDAKSATTNASTVAGAPSRTSARAAARASAGIASSAQGASVPGSDDLASVVAPGQAPSMGEVIARLHDAGIHTGLGAFNPPGTSPPLIGLAVPDDYVLPPGYVRHFQATDDGQRIEPILMYSPDVELFDAAGQRIPIPADRVVPPERAPPGLALRAVRIPPPLDPRGPAT